VQTQPGFIRNAVIAGALAAVSAWADSAAFACAESSASAGSRIEEASFVPLGGIEQWVTIRGEDRSNPILLHVHGGPGVAFSAYTEEFAPYEADFTVVQWDQRGAGCTFGRSGGKATPEVTLDRIASDGIDLATQLRSRLGNRKIILLGHSLGSIVATKMALREPELFAVYVGTGQFVSVDEIVKEQLVYLRKLAAAGDTDLGAAIDAIAKLDSQGLEQFFAVNRELATRVPAVDGAWYQHWQSRTRQAMTPDELADWQAGRQTSIGWLLPDARKVNLIATVQRIEIPLVVIQGSDDVYTPAAPAIAYFERVAAPAKELVVVEGAGHFPHLTHTEQFLAALVRTVRPLALR
jgi:pimeloyl-ACP methyl ester carboxylesterase